MRWTACGTIALIAAVAVTASGQTPSAKLPDRPSLRCLEMAAMAQCTFEIQYRNERRKRSDPYENPWRGCGCPSSLSTSGFYLYRGCSAGMIVAAQDPKGTAEKARLRACPSLANAPVREPCEVAQDLIETTGPREQAPGCDPAARAALEALAEMEGVSNCGGFQGGVPKEGQGIQSSAIRDAWGAEADVMYRLAFVVESVEKGPTQDALNAAARDIVYARNGQNDIAKSAYEDVRKLVRSKLHARDAGRFAISSAVGLVVDRATVGGLTRAGVQQLLSEGMGALAGAKAVEVMQRISAEPNLTPACAANELVKAAGSTAQGG